MNTDSFGSLDSEYAVVTGASSGIGREIAIELARGGADLTLLYRNNLAGVEQTAERVRQHGRKASIRQLDLACTAMMKPLVDSLFEGEADPTIWVNNAGVDLLTGENRDCCYAEKLQLLLDVDVRGTVLISRLVGERFASNRRGVIINMGWDQAERGMEGDSGELFAVAKNAIMGFSRSLALSLAPDVRVNCIAPGWIRTSWGESVSDKWQQRVIEETPLRRWGTPQDIAKIVRYLVSRDASYITGQVFYANGGAER